MEDLFLVVFNVSLEKCQRRHKSQASMNLLTVGSSIFASPYLKFLPQFDCIMTEITLSGLSEPCSVVSFKFVLLQGINSEKWFNSNNRLLTIIIEHHFRDYWRERVKKGIHIRIPQLVLTFTSFQWLHKGQSFHHINKKGWSNYLAYEVVFSLQSSDSINSTGFNRIHFDDKRA